MTQTTTTLPTSDLHTALAIAWCRYNGQRGTAKQIAPVMRRQTVETLTRMLAERGYHVVEQIGD